MRLLYQAQVVSQTWAHHCDKHFLITSINETMGRMFPNKSIENNEPFPMLQPAGLVNDTYTQLTSKLYATIKHIYKHHNDYDWYLKADDDTFIFVDNLLKFTRQRNASDLAIYGFLTRNKDLKVKYLTGGAGYLIGLFLVKNQKRKMSFNPGVFHLSSSELLRKLDLELENRSSQSSGIGNGGKLNQKQKKLV
jgi:hypothetical protein